MWRSLVIKTGGLYLQPCDAGRLFFFIISGLFFSGSVYSQDIIHYTKDNGLPSDRVYMVTVDKFGFIWCATDKGIAMFNGEKFTSYTTHNGLPLNDLWKIYPTNDGRVWYFGKSNELGYIDNGRVYKFPTRDGSIISPTGYYFKDNQVYVMSIFGCYYLEGDAWNKVQLSWDKLIRMKDAKTQGYSFFNFINPINNVVITLSQNDMSHLDTNMLDQANFKIPGDPFVGGKYSP